MRLLLATLLHATLLLATPAAPAQDTVFYRCTDASGTVSMQNGTPCAPGMKQEIRRIGEVRTVPVPRKPAEAQAPPPVPVYGKFELVSGPNMKRAPAPEAAGLPPPPPLFQCTSWDGETYFGEHDDPPPRCAPLQVVGIDGSAERGMGQACEMKHDSCTAIPEPQLCAAWYRRLDDAEFKLRYASDDNRQERQATFDALQAKVDASLCATRIDAATDPATGAGQKP